MTYWGLNTFSYVDNPYFAIILCKLKKRVSIAQQGSFYSQSIEPLTSKCVVLLRQSNTKLHYRGTEKSVFTFRWPPSCAGLGTTPSQHGPRLVGFSALSSLSLMEMLARNWWQATEMIETDHVHFRPILLYRKRSKVKVKWRGPANTSVPPSAPGSGGFRDLRPLSGALGS